MAKPIEDMTTAELEQKIHKLQDKRAEIIEEQRQYKRALSDRLSQEQEDLLAAIEADPERRAKHQAVGS